MVAHAGGARRLVVEHREGGGPRSADEAALRERFGYAPLVRGRRPAGRPDLPERFEATVKRQDRLMLVPTRRSWKEVARVTGLTKKDTETIIDTVFGGVVHALHRGEKVELRGFGSFRLRRREPHRGRNPRTGDRVDVPSKRVAYFKPGKELKELINREPAPAGPAVLSSPTSMSDAGTRLSWPEGRPGGSAGRHDQRIRSANIGEETCQPA